MAAMVTQRAISTQVITQIRSTACMGTVNLTNDNVVHMAAQSVVGWSLLLLCVPNSEKKGMFFARACAPSVRPSPPLSWSPRSTGP